MSVENIVNINESNLQQVLEQSMTTPVLFYFWSERSQHCLQLTPILESLAAQYNGQFILAKLDCDAEQMIAAQFGLRAIPTVYLFQNGQPVDGFQGPQPEEAIRALLDKVLPREEELKAQQAMQLMQEGNYTDALPLLKDAWRRIQKMPHWRRNWRCNCIRLGAMKRRWSCCSGICVKISPPQTVRRVKRSRRSSLRWVRVMHWRRSIAASCMRCCIEFPLIGT